MSTLASALNSALKSMTASQLSLSVASNNIANATTPGYSRQRLVTTPSGPDGGVLGIGTGVDAVRVQAMRDELIETRLKQETSAKSGDDARSRMLSDVETVFNDTDDAGLLLKITNFFNSFQTLSLDPASTNFREELKINAQALVEDLHARNRDLTEIRGVANQGITTDIDKINGLTKQIATVTQEIKYQEVSHPANDLRDRRAALVKDLSEIIQVHELESGGDYQLSTKDNQLLVLNTTARPLTEADVTPAIGDGSLKAKLDVRDQYIPKYIGALDQLAYELVVQVNSIHTSAYDLNGDTGVNFFGPLSSASGASRLIDMSTKVQGDARSIAASALPTGNDNQAAMRLGNLLHDPVFTGGSITDQYRTIVFRAGSDLSNVETSLKEHDAMVLQLENRRQSVSGVSIDEETAQILQFQRSFEASARLIRTIDELLQVAIGMGA